MVILVRVDNDTRHALAHLLLLRSELFGMSHLEGRIASMEHWEGTGLNAIYPYVHRVRRRNRAFPFYMFLFFFSFSRIRIRTVARVGACICKHSLLHLH